MLIDWNAFTPLSAAIGGVLIGAAAVMFALLNGRIAGISGIVSGVVHGKPGDRAWRLAFVAGLVGAPLLYGLATTVPPLRVDAGFPTLIIAGLLVGIGTRYGAGCTSGHGVCGLSRLSPRALMATLSFMCAGFLTVFVMRHLLNA